MQSFLTPNHLRRLLWLLPVLILAGCGNPLAGIPPTPTPNPAAGGPIDNHQHGEGSTGGRLITRYGGPLASTVIAQPEKPDPGSPFNITYRLRDKAGSPVTADKLAITHEKPMHLIVVSSDLRRFAHIHPTHEAEGLYTVETALPEAGSYLLFNEFFTSDGTMQIERNELSTSEIPAETAAPSLLPDLNTQLEVGELSVVLKANVQKVRRRSPITFTLTSARNGEPVTDLEPYLGAPCHVVIISADTKQFAHTHGDIPGGTMSGGTSGGDMTNMANMVMPTPPARFGPNIQFTHTFMQAGMYRVSVQFVTQDEVVRTAHNIQILK